MRVPGQEFFVPAIKMFRGQHPQEVALQATCIQPKAGQDRHRRGCKGLKPQQHTQGPLLLGSR
jgi:hypothetical protein